MYFVTAAEFACFHDFCSHLLTNPVKYIHFHKACCWPQYTFCCRANLTFSFYLILHTGERNESLLFTVLFILVARVTLLQVPCSGRQIAVGCGRGAKKGAGNDSTVLSLVYCTSKPPGELQKNCLDVWYVSHLPCF